MAVDWPHAKHGPAFLDVTGMLPAIDATGGPAPGEVLARVPLPDGTEEEAAVTWVAVLTAYFTYSSLQDPPLGIPHLRAFQRDQAVACVAWLRDLLGQR